MNISKKDHVTHKHVRRKCHAAVGEHGKSREGNHMLAKYDLLTRYCEMSRQRQTEEEIGRQF